MSWSGVAVAVGTWSIGAWGLTAGAARASDIAAPAATAGLEQGWTSAAGTWAVVAMGHLGQPTNTFWQVLFRATGKARWTLVTPPGVASNGGFSAAGSPAVAGTGGGEAGDVTAGFQPTNKLTYSPIAVTSDDGKSWSAGTLSAALSPVADAVAGTGGREVFALVRSDGGTLLRSATSLTTWKTVLTRRGLDASPVGGRCAATALTAVIAVGAAKSPELGAACATPGIIGLFHQSSGAWVATPVRVGTGSRSTFTVLRLESTASGTSAIVEARRPGVASLFALWRTGPFATWTLSSPLRLHGAVVSTASTAAGSLLVLTGDGFDAHALWWIGGPGSVWRSLGPPPRGAQVVVSPPGATATDPAATPGDLTALSVSGSTVRVWRRNGDGHWRRTAQRLDVPIEYGSST